VDAGRRADVAPQVRRHSKGISDLHLDKGLGNRTAWTLGPAPLWERDVVVYGGYYYGIS